jgi:L-fuculose-phosphate aldolase
MNETDIRRDLVDHARRMNDLGINQGRSGNVSARWDDGFLVTPSAISYDDMGPNDLVRVRWDGSTEGEHPPSTEWRLHRDIYRHCAEAAAIVHAHAMFATTLACLDRGVPAFHYMIAVAGGTDIRCAPYATFGSQEISDRALAALKGRRACLHAHHGMTVFSDSLPAALALAVEVETLAAMYWRALQIGEPAVLSDEEMNVVLEKFTHYGKGGPAR